MPSYIIKAEPDQDFYVMWSEVVDAPTAWGSRADLEGWFQPSDVAAERFDRADAHGTSCRLLGPGIRFYDWTDAGMVYQQEGFLPRSRLRELCDRLEKDEHAPVSDLLTPFDDE